jgi:hypothetical protein
MTTTRKEVWSVAVTPTRSDIIMSILRLLAFCCAVCNIHIHLLWDDVSAKDVCSSEWDIIIIIIIIIIIMRLNAIHAIGFTSASYYSE